MPSLRALMSYGHSRGGGAPGGCSDSRAILIAPVEHKEGV